MKDKKLRMRAKGLNPEILLECTIHWNPVSIVIVNMHQNGITLCQHSLNLYRPLVLQPASTDKEWYWQKISCLLCIINFFENRQEMPHYLLIPLFQLRAAVRTFMPKEEKFMQVEQKFKRQVFITNVNRLKACIMDFIEGGKFIK